MIGAIADSPGGVSQGGSAFVVYGDTSFAQAELDFSALNGVNGSSISNYNTSDYFGEVGTGLDFNGDGLNDIVIGAHLGDPDSSRENAGKVYLIYGSNSRVDANLDLDALDGSNGFVINGIDASDMAGISVSIPGDFNDDGFDDLLISAGGADPNGNSNAGEVYLVYGSDSLTSSSLELSSLDGTNGTVFKGVDADDFIGRYAPSAGDYNSDGVDDIVISTHSGGGEAYVVYGFSDAESSPAAPSTPDLIAASDSGNSDTDNSTNDTTPSFSGTAEASSTVEVFADGVSLGTTTADANGDWTFTVADSNAFADGSYSVTAKALTELTSSDPSPALTLTIDTSAPAFVSAEANSSGQIVLTYDEDLDVTTISPSAFTVTVDSSQDIAVSSVEVVGDTVVLTLESLI